MEVAKGPSLPRRARGAASYCRAVARAGQAALRASLREYPAGALWREPGCGRSARSGLSGAARELQEARGPGQHCALQVELGLFPARAAEGCGCELSLLLPALPVQAARHWCSDGGDAASSSPAPSSGLNAPHVDAHQVSFPLDDSQETCSLNYI